MTIKYPICGTIFLKFGQKWIFHKNWAPLLFKIYSPLTLCKKSEKTNSANSEKNIFLTDERTNKGEHSVKQVGPIIR